MTAPTVEYATSPIFDLRPEGPNHDAGEAHDGDPGGTDVPLAVSGPPATVHAIELLHLAPGQRYYYRVTAAGHVLAGDESYFFETDGGRNDAETSFFVTADVGEPGGDLDATVARILVAEPRVELGLIAGDVVYPDGESEDYDAHFMRPWAAILRSIAVWPALGNHDWNVDPEQNFAQEWYLPHNEHYYSFDRANAHFVALDTGSDGGIHDRAAQVAWLGADLAANRDATWTFVYYHHPGTTCTYKGDAPAVIESFHPLFDAFQVDVVFMGHAHTYERMYPLRGGVPVNQEQEPHYVDPPGTIYIITGCGATSSGDSTPDCELNAAVIDDTILFTHVAVQGRSVTIRTLESATGIVRDRVTIRKGEIGARLERSGAVDRGRVGDQKPRR